VSNLNSIIQKFSDVKVLVIGDVMLDQYLWGSVERISPEAPVPVVKLQKTSLVLGGAANVAANIAGLGAKPILIGAIGVDNESKLFKPLLDKLKISPANLVKIKNRPTTIKTRIVAHNQHVVRIDQENNQYLSKTDEEKVWKKIEEAIDKTEIIIVSDYAKGVLTENLLSRLITTAKQKRKKLLVDPKGNDYKKYKGADILTPNRFEAAQACHLPADGQEIVEQAGEMLIKNLNLESVLITQGEDGMTLFQKGGKPFHLDALARKVYDVTGAGDTVIAAFGVSLGSGSDLLEASEIANISAGIVVEEIGTTTITLEKLQNFLEK
jgi:D-beta-D-heptose 7-phosphate kinase/D-beta-D-heptose 1-phosphate adenosyltransferase